MSSLRFQGRTGCRKAPCVTAVRCYSSSGRFGCCPSLCPSLHMRSCVCVFVVLGVCHVFQMSCFSGCFACEEHCKPQRDTPQWVPQRVLSPRWEGTDKNHATQQRQTEQKKHAFFKRKYADCERGNQPLCTNHSQTSKRRLRAV